MGKREYQVEFYEMPDGTKPLKNYLKELAPKLRAKIYRAIDMLEENGPELREPTSKLLREGIFELRAQVGSDISRVLYFFSIDRKAILVSGFTKKTQKTPQAEIEKAEKYRNSYMRRKGVKDERME